MRAILLFVLLLTVPMLFAGCSGSSKESSEVSSDTNSHSDPATQTETLSEEDALHKADPVGAYGEAFTAVRTLSIGSLLADAESHEGDRVVVEGTVVEVCPMRGCWIEMEQDGEHIRVKVVDGDIVFPLSAQGHPVRVEGVVERIELDEEEARGWMAHEAEEKGEAFDPTTITGPMVIWRLQGKGAQISG